jgi:hypothetical protein
MTVNCTLEFDFPSGGPNGTLKVIARLAEESSSIALKDDGLPLATEMYSIEYANGYTAVGTSLACENPYSYGLTSCFILETGVANSTEQSVRSAVTVLGTGFRILEWNCAS